MIIRVTQIRPWWVEVRINPLHHLYAQPRSGESKGKALMHAFAAVGIPFTSMILFALEAWTVSEMMG